MITLYVTNRQGDAVVLRAAPSPKGAGDGASSAPWGQGHRRRRELRRVLCGLGPRGRGSAYGRESGDGDLTHRFGIVREVISRRDSAVRCLERSGPSRLLDGWPSRVALLLTAIGLVLMHHVVGAHQHSPSDALSLEPTAHSAHADGLSTPMFANVGQATAAPGADLRAHDARPAAQTANPTALLHLHPDPGGHDHLGALLHMCLVALAAAVVVLLALALVATGWQFDRVKGTTDLRWSGPTAHPPPVPARLAQLQVLRL